MSEIREYHIEVLGRTLEHLGAQMYKRRDAAIAELIANCWDAGATRVDVVVPTEERTASSTIVVSDDGSGMTPDEIEEKYLIVSRNCRDGGGTVTTRPVMGKKGIGKLAGFGLARAMEVSSWRDGRKVKLKIDATELSSESLTKEKRTIIGEVSEVDDQESASGTRITMSGLRHTTPMDLGRLRENLARRFSGTVNGQMQIFVNGIEVARPEWEFREESPSRDFLEHVLPDGSVVRYWYSFAKKPVSPKSNRGFVVYVRGRVAQAAPFFFNIEGTASGQWSEKYIVGEIEADFLDPEDSESVYAADELIATDRQEVEWEHEVLNDFNQWGEELARSAFSECADLMGDAVERDLLPVFEERLNRLARTSRDYVVRFVRMLSKSTAKLDQEQAETLADSIVKAFEFQDFHDVIADLTSAAEDGPDTLVNFLERLKDWKVLEGRAVLEVVSGRVGIIEKTQSMIAANAPERGRAGAEDLHTLIAKFPWLLGPQLQAFAEEKSLRKVIEDHLGAEVFGELGDDGRKRVDFLALGGDGRVVVVEIKRSAQSVTLDELQRVEKYRIVVERSSGDPTKVVLICSDKFDLPQEIEKEWRSKEWLSIRSWGAVFKEASRHYSRYRAILEGDASHHDFERAKSEVVHFQRTFSGNMSRTKEERDEGLGLTE